MRFSIGLFASASASAFVLGLLACSSPNPLGGLPYYGPSQEDAGASSANSNPPGDDNNEVGDDDNGSGSTPSPLNPNRGLDAGLSLGDDGGSASAIDDGGDAATLPSDGGAPSSDSGTSSALLVRCVSDLDSYRSQAGVTALTESSALEAYGALAAASDAQSGTTHGYFNSNQGNGVSAAESELPGWPLAQYASLSDLVDQGVAAIFNEGPGSAPYDHLVDPTFTQAGCGVTTTTDGNVWVTFEYK